MCCSMRGIVYVKNGQPVCNQWFTLDNPFITGPTGEYTTRVFSRIAHWTHIQVSELSYPDISSINYSLRPDSVIYRDIQLLNTIIESTSKPVEPYRVMKIFPNPVRNSLNISLNLDLSQPVFEFTLTIMDLKGRTIEQQKMESAFGMISLPVDLVSGTYIAQLEGDGKIIQNSSFIVQR